MSHTLLANLPLEVLRNILVFLDVPSLLQISRTSHLLRSLSLDPLLQKARLRRVRTDLRFLLLHRLPKASISPPNSWIWMSKTNVLSRSISKSLIRIRLTHSLERRPSIDYLVERAILPECCSRGCTDTVNPAVIISQEATRKSHLKNKLGQLIEGRPSIERIVELNIMPAECASGGIVSPKLVETRRMVIKEKLKDSLRDWVKGKAIEEQKRQEEIYDNSANRPSVKATVRRFAARKAATELETAMDRVSLEKKQAQSRWGRQLEVERKREEAKRAAASGACSQPTRAHVLGLKRFWEGVIRTAAR